MLVGKIMADLKNDIGYIFETLLLYAGHRTRKELFRFELTANSKDEFKFYKALSGGNDKINILYSVGIKYSDSENSYICISGVEESDFYLPDDFDFVEINCPHFIYSASRIGLEVKSQLNRSELENNFIGQPDDNSYQGTSLSDIQSYFNDIVIIRFDKNSIYDSFNFDRLLYFILSFNKKIMALENSNLKCLYQSLFLDFDNISHSNIFISMTCFHKKHAFLEAYRCIEWLYPIPRVHNLKRSISYGGKAIELARKCASDLSWRRKEEDSLSLLVKYAFSLDAELKETVSWSTFMKDLDEDKAATKLYAYRNQLVHQFSPEYELAINNDILEELIFFVLKLIKVLYTEYKLDLS